MDDVEERIHRRAYEIWEREGRPHGRDSEHWQRAREEILTALPPAERADATAQVPEEPPARLAKGAAKAGKSAKEEPPPAPAEAKQAKSRKGEAPKRGARAKS